MNIVELASMKQPHPKKGNARVIDVVWPGLHRGSIRDGDLVDCLRERAKSGLAKYGVYLETNNGRDALVDAFQEALDLVMYLEQYREELVESETKNNAHHLFEGARYLAHDIMRELEARNERTQTE